MSNNWIKNELEFIKECKDYRLTIAFDSDWVSIIYNGPKNEFKMSDHLIKMIDLNHFKTYHAVNYSFFDFKLTIKQAAEIKKNPQMIKNLKDLLDKYFEKIDKLTIFW